MTAQRSNESIPMTAAGLRELREELERLRDRTRLEIADRLRDARAYGEGSGNDEYHAIREDQMVLEARMRSLEETVARATLMDDSEAENGAAAVGSTVLIEDLESGALSRYRIYGAYGALVPDGISAGSPMGRALLGAAPGESVTVDLPNGARRSVRLVQVTSPTHDDRSGELPSAA